MRFALIDNKLVQAEPGLVGSCSGCLQPVIAKCGIQRIHHWAHRNKVCDSWWEPETEWHRSWKNKFPMEWQEIFLPDTQTGEKHIADVRSSYGLVIEFQHSHLDPQERNSRENFYRNMIWVVDGTRLKRDYPRFLNRVNTFHPISQGTFKVVFPEECFPTAWLNSSVPVIFDFQGTGSIDDLKDNRTHLYCLIPTRLNGNAILVVVARNEFIDSINTNNWSFWLTELINNINQVNQEQQQQIEFQRRKQEKSMAFQKFLKYSVPKRYGRGRRF